jgi:tripartite-type tricarboxylate transporter receptor subunit TctC
LDRLTGYFQKVVATPDAQKGLEKLGMVPAYKGPEEFGKFIRNELGKGM